MANIQSYKRARKLLGSVGWGFTLSGILLFVIGSVAMPTIDCSGGVGCNNIVLPNPFWSIFGLGTGIGLFIGGIALLVFRMASARIWPNLSG